MDVNGSTGAPQPVPQALYVNNSALPTLNLPSSFISTSLGQNPPPSPVGLPTANGRSLISNHSTPPLSNLSGLRGSATVQPGPPPALVPVSSSAGGRSHVPGFPPPYSEAVTSNVTRRPSLNQAPPTQQLSRAPPPAPQQSSVTNGADGMRVSLEAYQIRVGTRKFMPASNVVFKDDGVLFTLREYTHAPLLLNARAITKCKAHLTQVHPVLFFALEASCVKQIRSIFQMSEDEFNEKDPLEKKRCITVFPKSLTTDEANAINHSFTSMKAKFGRLEAIVLPIDMDTAIDILFGSGERTPSQPSALTSAPARQATTNGVSSNTNRGHPYQRPQAQVPQVQQQQQAQHHQQQLQHQQLQRQQQLQHQQQQQQQRGLQNNMLQNPNSMMLQSMRPQSHMAPGVRLPMPNFGAARIATSTPVTIPADGASFAALQKTLLPNMIYPVIQPGDNRRVTHCLWNGNTFIPLPSDDLRLHCHNVRVGSIRSQSGEPVIIKNQNSRLSIHFKVKLGSEPCGFQVSEDELSHCFICFQKVTAMFLFPNSAFCQRVRYTLKMKQPPKDPSYDINSTEERQRHLVLFLRDVSPQMKDDLLKLKRLMGQSNKPFISELDAQGALKILRGIKTSTSPAKITDYVGDQYSELHALATEIATVDPSPPAADDDDDDVIMTSEELTIKCPYTQQVMKEPVRNKNCSHNYEKVAIHEFIARRRAKGTDKTAKCPYAGCGNQVPLTMEDLEDNAELKEYIRRKTASSASTTPSVAS